MKKRKTFNLFKQGAITFSGETSEWVFYSDTEPQKVQLLMTTSKSRRVKPRKGKWEISESYWELNGDHIFTIKR